MRPAGYGSSSTTLPRQGGRQAGRRALAGRQETDRQSEAQARRGGAGPVRSLRTGRHGLALTTNDSRVESQSLRVRASHDSRPHGTAHAQMPTLARIEEEGNCDAMYGQRESFGKPPKNRMSNTKVLFCRSGGRHENASRLGENESRP